MTSLNTTMTFTFVESVDDGSVADTDDCVTDADDCVTDADDCVTDAGGFYAAAERRW